MTNYVSIMLFILGPILCGLIIFATLSYLFVPIKITVPVTIIVSVLIAVLTIYYNSQIFDVISNSNKVRSQSSNSGSEQHLSNNQYVQTLSKNEAAPDGIRSNLIFLIGIYIICLAIVALPSDPNSELFIPWNEITPLQIAQLGAAIVLCFFLPGYGMVLTLDTSRELGLLPRVLLGYIFSMLITGLVAYAVATAGLAVLDAKTILLTIHIIVLASLALVQFVLNRSLSTRYGPLLLSPIVKAFFAQLKKNISEIIVFSCLIALIVLYTYYLHGGIIVGDQWFHHGRSLLFMNGTFRDFSSASSDTYPPLLSALLSGLYTLSGVPSVNAYASIHFLNIMPVLGFYYFFKKWVPPQWRGASLIASVLFMLSSGFGWLYILDIALTDGTLTSISSAFDLLHSAGLEASDIRHATNFIISSHPDVSTGLQIISLPAGFTLLGLINEEINRRRYILVFAAIGTLAIFSHDEFYLFVIIASLLPLIFNLKHKNYVYAGLLAAISVSILTDVVSPANYFTDRKILGVPLIALCFLFMSTVWALNVSGILYKIQDKLKITVGRISQISLSMRIKEHSLERAHDNNYVLHDRTTGNNFIRFSFAVVVTGVVAYFYLFSLIVWGELSQSDIRAQTTDFTVPWYLYPMKFGVTGLLALVFVLSYMFKKFRKIFFVFGIIALIALLTSPYYYDHRFSKYVMAGMVGFAALLFYKILIRLSTFQGKRIKPLARGLFVGLVVTSAGFSTLMYIGYSIQAFENPEFAQFYRRDFPSLSEIAFLDRLRNDIIDIRTDNIIAPGRWEDFTSKLDGFVGTSVATLDKYMKNQLTLNATTPETFYDLLNYGDINYIILPKKEYIDGERDVNLQYPVRFALDNFQKAYEDDNYVVLTVPANLAPPSDNGVGTDTALVYKVQDKILSLPQQSMSSSSLSSLSEQISTTVLLYDNKSFKGLEGESKLIKTVAQDKPNSDSSIVNQNNNNNDDAAAVILYGDKQEKGGITLWSYPLLLEEGRIRLLEQEAKREGGGEVEEKEEEKDNNDNINNNKSRASTAINYIQAKIRIVDENTSKNHDAGIKWTDESKNEYYAVLRNDRFELEMKQTLDNTSYNDSKQEDDNKSNSNNDNKLYYFQNRELRIEKGIWYELQVVVTQNTINVYVDNILAIKAPRVFSNQSVLTESRVNTNDVGNENATIRSTKAMIPPDSISRIGIRSFHNTAEFQPVVVGHLSSPEIILDSANYQQELYHHYYPLSLMALSGMKYETFVYGDYSALSKKYVILPFDPLLFSSSLSSSSTSSSSSFFPPLYSHSYYSKDQNNTVNRYLEYANSGGNLVIIHTDKNFDGIFNKLISIKPSGIVKFDSIVEYTSTSDGNGNSSGNTIDISRDREEYVKDIEFPNTSGDKIVIKSVYANKSSNSENSDPSSSINKNNKDNHTSVAAVDAVVDATSSAAPFVIEKQYGAGKIIFVNAEGYFNALFNKANGTNKTSKDNNNTFQSFEIIPHMLNFLKLQNNSATQGYEQAGISNTISNQAAVRDTISINSSNNNKENKDSGRDGDDYKDDKDASNPSARFTGDMQISSADDILIKSSSLLFPQKITDSFDIHIEDINYKISHHEWKNNNSDPSEDQEQKQSQKQKQGEQYYPDSKDINFKNVLLKHLRLYGNYEVTINSTAGRLNLPSFPSNYDYFTIPVQGGFDMKIKKLEDNINDDTSVRTSYNSSSSSSSTAIMNSTRYTPPDSPADITVIDNANIEDNNKSNNTQQSTKITLTDDDEIILHNIRAKAKTIVEEQPLSLSSSLSSPSSLQKYQSGGEGLSHSQQQRILSSPSSLDNSNDDDSIAIPLVIKGPEITIINGTARFDRLHDPDRLWETLSFPPVEVSGKSIGLKLNYVDYNHEPYRKVGTRTGYITFFNWMDDRIDNPDNVKFTYEGINQAQGIQIPADISENAKSKGIGVPWEKAITSLNGLILLTAIVVGAPITIVIYYMHGKQ